MAARSVPILPRDFNFKRLKGDRRNVYAGVWISLDINRLSWGGDNITGIGWAAASFGCLRAGRSNGVLDRKYNKRNCNDGQECLCVTIYHICPLFRRLAVIGTLSPVGLSRTFRRRSAAPGGISRMPRSLRSGHLLILPGLLGLLVRIRVRLLTVLSLPSVVPLEGWNAFDGS